MSKHITVEISCDTASAVASFKRARSALVWLANIRLIAHFGLLDGDA